MSIPSATAVFILYSYYYPIDNNRVRILFLMLKLKKCN